MVKNAPNINKSVLVPDPSQYLDLQRYISWSSLWSVILRSDVIVCFVDIDGLVDHHGLNLHLFTMTLFYNVHVTLHQFWVFNQVSHA
jgi:hypothetical protein